MNGFIFQKATKEKAKLRLALFGPSGAGKTYTGLRIATGMSKKIAVIDTERGSASKYADRFTFDVLELPKNDIETYTMAIKTADQAGYEILIIDSLSHAWQELLEEIDKLAYSKYQGNTWAAWSKGTPKQRQLVDAILSFSGHVIATMRSKTEWTTSSDSNGKNKPVRVGLAPEQGKGIEYEFDMLMELSTNHIAEVIKDRTGKYQDKLIDKPSEQFGIELVAWLNSGEAKPKSQPVKQSNHPEIPDSSLVEVAQELGGVVKTTMSLETAEAVTSSDGTRYGDIETEKLVHMANAIAKSIKKNGISHEEHETRQMKLNAIRVILESRNQ